MADDDIFGDIINDLANQGRRAAVANVDANPDDGADALSLSAASGVPPMAVYGDLKGFRQRYKSQLASSIVGNNPELNSFIRSNVLAPVVTNDDYGNLDQFSRGTKQTKSILNDVVSSTSSGIVAGTEAIPAAPEFVMGGSDWFGAKMAKWLFGIDPEDYKAAQLRRFDTSTPIGALSVGTRIVAGMFAEAGEEAGEAVTGGLGSYQPQTPYGEAAKTVGMFLPGAIGGPEGVAQRLLARTVAPAVAFKGGEELANRLDPSAAPYAGIAAAILAHKAVETSLARVRQWTDAGEEPPKGVDPQVDQYKALVNAAALKAFNEDYARAQASLTKERSPEMFQQFVEKHFGNAQIEIAGDRVAALYGDREPTPDDGLLGWVPGIETHLALARDSGVDVPIPIKDWMTHATPEVNTALNDSIRMYPGGITARESMVPAVQGIIADTAEMGISVQPQPTLYETRIDAPLPAVRGADAMEPMFSIGDRKLLLQRTAGGDVTIEANAQRLAQMDGKDWNTLTPEELKDYRERGAFVRPSWAINLHDFHLLDQNGNTVGTLNLSEQRGGKDIYVEMISGVNGFGVRDFGPSLTRDLLRQIKAEFPNMERIGGDRVSGAREKFGTEGLVWVKLDTLDPSDVGRFRDILEGGEWRAYHPTVEGYVKAKTDPQTQAIADVAREELARIAPGAEVHVAQRIRTPLTKGEVGGATIPRRGLNSIILLATDSGDMRGVAHHEAIEYLRQAGLFTGPEWEQLTRRAREGGWINKFNIERRYPDAGNAERLKESIAEGYRDWEAGKAEVGPELHPIFQKIKEFLDAIRQRINDILGRPGTVDDIFERISSGEVGARESQVPEWERLRREANGEAPSMSVEPPRPANDPDLQGGREKFPTYRAAQNDQLIRKYTAEGADTRDFAAWQKEAEEKNIGTSLRPDRPNAFSAAKQASEGGKTTVVISPSLYGEPGKRTVYHNGVKVAYDSWSDLKQMRPDEPSFSVGEEEEPKPSYQDLLDRIRADALGLDAKTLKNLKGEYKDRYDRDLAKAQAKAEAQQKLEQTKEWKKEYSEVRAQVEDKLRHRPDIAADLFFSHGDLFGRKVEPIRIDSSTLTDAQKEALPRNYYGKTGLPADVIGQMFGMTGDRMVETLAQLRQTGESAVERLGRLTKDQTNTEMAARHGDLQSNILSEAKDQALAEVDENILAQEMYSVAALAGTRPIDMAFIKETAKTELDKLPIGSVSSERFRATMSKHGRDAYRAAINKDWSSAIVSMQQRTYAGMLALEAKRLETEMARAEKIITKYRKIVVKNVDPEYVNAVHQIMDQIGRPSRRTMEDVTKDIAARGQGELKDFIAWKTQQMRVIHPSPEVLAGKRWENFDDITVNEFHDVSKMLRTLDFNGRNELKLVRAGESSDFGELRAQLLETLQQFKERFGDVEGRPIGTGETKALARRALAAHLQLETIFNHWDHYDPQGVWNQWVMRDLVDGANQVDKWKKDYAKKLLELDDGIDTRKRIENNLFRDYDEFGRPGPLWQMNRGNLRAAMLNAGTKSNLEKLAYGYRLRPEQVMEWIHQNATKEDWDFVQKMWDNVFKDLKGKIDTMYRSLTGGVAPPDVPAVPIDTPFGRYDGGYYPIIFHREYEGASKKLMGRDPLEQNNYFSAMTPSGHTISRTGYTAPLSLNLDFLPGRIGQMLHDTALRPAVINASKVFYDKTIRKAIQIHAGAEYKDLLIPYLQGVANSANYMTRAAREFTNWSEFARQNMISTLVGLNPGTVGKHFFTALWQSAQEVGTSKFLTAAFRDIFTRNEETGDSMWKFARDNSLELQRRDRNWFETLGGATEQLVPKKGFDTLRNKMIMFASKPVAFSDMISAVPTWVAKYREIMEETGDHGEAVSQADRAVRRAHGSTAITSRPEIMRIGNPWFTSVYNFFNHIMNRQAEMVWQAGEARGIWKEGQKAEAMSKVPALTAQLAAYVLFPSLVEYTFSGEKHDKNESPWAAAAKALALDVSASWIGVRDLANYFIHGGEPSIGLMSTGLRELGNVWRDAMKKDPAGREHAGMFLEHAAGLIGALTGMMPAQVGRTARGVYDINTGRARPRDAMDWWSQLRYGTMEGHTR